MRALRTASLLALTTTALLGGAGTGVAAAQGNPWRQVGHTTAENRVSGEGITTLRLPGQAPETVYRNGATIPQPLKDEGWGHVGDPDSLRGYVFDVYQDTVTPTPAKKMYLVTKPDGTTTEFVHPLQADEPAVNANAQVAATPDGQWLVSGPLGEVDRLYVSPTPFLNPRAPRVAGDLPIAARIHLDHHIRSAQGCDFVSSTRLVCATSDPNNDLYPTNLQLLQVDLARPLNGHDVTAKVRELGQVPLVSTCTGTFTPEGVDYDAPTGVLRVEVVPPSPCNTVTDVYSFERR
ncbi:hypothetical protein [Amycolatopsis sp. NBC_01286]|uniref:hypothetical protein n=1 Tax=Amycolatopsis sp. NBC_01286 TaxID=2903560 RepID=UPI002E11AA90|nr:hypothetical protein OG570_47475 [Amycolatopsis sp. NBC_01286]